MSAVLSTAQEDRLWSQLIRFIGDGAVVPSIGPELLDIPGEEGGSMNFCNESKTTSARCGRFWRAR